MDARNVDWSNDDEEKQLARNFPDSGPLKPLNTHRNLQKFFSKKFASLSCSSGTETENTASNVQPESMGSLRNILLPGLIESCVGLGYASAVIPFLEPNSSWWKNPFTMASIVLSANFLSRTIELMPRFNSLPHKNKKQILQAWRFARGLLFSSLDLATRDVLIHEGGHALTTLCLFQNANPRITVTPGFMSAGGYTSFSDTTRLNNLGETLGNDKSWMLVSAGGTGATMLWNYGSLIAAQAIPNDDSEIKSYLRFVVLVSVIHSVWYALSAYVACEPPGHDFCSLDKNGISPAVAASFIVGSMMFLQLLLSGISYGCRATNKKDDQQQPQLEIQEAHDIQTEAALDPEADETNNETARLMR